MRNIKCYEKHVVLSVEVVGITDDCSSCFQMCLGFNFTGILLVLELFLVWAKRIDWRILCLLWGARAHTAWLHAVWGVVFLNRTHLSLCTSGLFLVTLCIWLHIWLKSKLWSYVCCAFCLWEVLGPGAGSGPGGNCERLLGWNLECGVDGNKHIDGG